MDKETFLKHLSILQENIGIEYGICFLSLKALKERFPSDENGHNEVEHYVFDLNFGKPTICSEYESPEMFWERLNTMHA